MLGELAQHVVKEPDAGGNLELAFAVNIEFYFYRGLFGLASDGCFPVSHISPSAVNLVIFS